MIFVWFVYGLAFFVLGLAVLIYPKKGSSFELAKHVWKIGAFGVLHGINEWLDMFIAIGEPFPHEFMEQARMVTLSGSFGFLLWFGGTAISSSFRYARPVRVLPTVLMLAWLVILPIIESQHRMVLGDILARYMLCVPGTFLTALALFSRVPSFKAMKLRSIATGLNVAAATTLLYGVLAGIVVKPAAVFPASVVNYETFTAATGVPVQVFRAACAVVLACSAIYVLDVFRWETQESLRMSELRCATVASAMPVFLFMTDRNIAVTFAQGKGLANLGLSPDRIYGRPIAEVFSSTGHFAEDCRSALAGRDVVTTASVDDMTFEVYCSALRDPQGEPVGIVGVVLDISAKIAAQRELETYRLTMEEQTRQAAVGTLSATMTQQLSEPISLARLVLDQTISDCDNSEANEAIRKNLAKGLSAVTEAYGVLERFSRVAHQGSPTGLEPVALLQIAKRMMRVFAESARYKELSIAIKDLDVVPLVSISARELEQVFYHLIQWAVDRADPDRKESLTIRCTAESGHIDLKFCLAQTTVGVGSSGRDAVEGDDGGRPDGSSQPLGLAIVDRIIRDHGGEVRRAMPRPGETEMTLRLPGKLPS